MVTTKSVSRAGNQAVDVVTAGWPWSFEVDGHLFRPVSDAHLRAKLGVVPDWGMVVCDEVRRMCAHVGAERTEPRRRCQLGKMIGNRCCNFVLITATLHSGNEADFQCFLQLLDNERFEGGVRVALESAHALGPAVSNFEKA